MTKPLALIGFIAAALLLTGATAAQRRSDARANNDSKLSFGYEVGELVYDFAFTDIAGKPGRLSSVLGTRATVIVVRDHGCPVSQKYGPRLARLERELAASGVAFVYVNVAPPDTASPPSSDVAQQRFAGRYIADTDARIANALRVQSTAEVFVLDDRRTLVYRGAVDDQHGLGFARPEARNHYLRDAVGDLLSGREVRTKETAASGCMLAIDRAARGKKLAATYHNRVSRIIQNNCQTCHRTGGIAPFPMETYQQVYQRRATVELMVSSGRMPPWFAERTVGEWANDRSLSARDKEDLLAWIKGGAPEGNKKDAPKPKTWADGWNIGKPNVVLELPEPQTVPAEGVVEYRYAYVKTDFPEDKWITAMEIRPTAPKVVHHVLVFIEEPGRKRDPAERKPGDPPFQGGINGFFAATAPGSVGVTYPAGAAKKLPKGAWLKFQLHYTPNGAPVTDRTRLGLIFADREPGIEVRTSSAFNNRFAIPPGAEHHEVVGEYTFRLPGTIRSFFPHMHLRGAAFKYELVHADGRVEPVLNVPRYDFNWQLVYDLENPVEVTAGTKLRATGWFDNSLKNPFNPDPTKEVKFGEQTFDEMMIGYFDWLPRAAPQPAGPGR